MTPNQIKAAIRTARAVVTSAKRQVYIALYSEDAQRPGATPLETLEAALAEARLHLLQLETENPYEALHA